MSYAGNGSSDLPAPRKRQTPAGYSSPKLGSQPDFDAMTGAEKVAFQKARWDRILG
jgi:hypothetical protein